MTIYNDTIVEDINNLDWVPQSWIEDIAESTNLLDSNANLQAMYTLLSEDQTLSETIIGLKSAVLQDLINLLDSNDTVASLTITSLDTINILDSYIAIKAVPAVDSIRVGDLVVSQAIDNIVEAVALSALLSSSANRSMELSDNLAVKDLIHIALTAIVVEDITESDTLVDFIAKLSSVYEKLALADTSATTATLSITIASALSLHSLANLGRIAELLTDGFTVDDSIVAIYNATVALVDALSIADVPSNSVKFIAIGDESLALADLISNTSALSNTVSEDMLFIVTINDGNKVYQGITMNPETYSITEYDNYAFNSTTNFQGSYLLASDAGLFKMEGDTDDGEYITSKVKTATIDFGTSNIKQVPKMYLGINNDASLILRVSVDGKYTTSYQLDIDSEDLTTQIFNIGKGLKGRYWQFEISTKSNSTFDLDEIELFPIQWGRKR